MLASDPLGVDAIDGISQAKEGKGDSVRDESCTEVRGTAVSLLLLGILSISGQDRA